MSLAGRQRSLSLTLSDSTLPIPIPIGEPNHSEDSPKYILHAINKQQTAVPPLHASNVLRVSSPAPLTPVAVVDRSESARSPSPAPSPHAAPIQLPAGRITGSGLSQQLKHHKWLAGLPPPLTHTHSTASTASPTSHLNGGFNGGSNGSASGPPSTRTSISYTGDGASPSDDVGTPDSGSMNCIYSGVRGRRHSNGHWRGSCHPAAIRNNRSQRSSYSTPQPHQTQAAGTPTSSMMGSRRPTLSGSSGIVAHDAPDGEAYVALLQKLLHRTTGPDIDIFRIDALTVSYAAHTAAPPLPASVGMNSFPSSSSSSPSPASASGSASASAAVLGPPLSSTPPSLATCSSASDDLLSDALSLAQSYRDELVLERFYRKQAQAQLQRRTSLQTHTSAIGGGNSPLPQASMTASPTGSAAPSNSHSLSLPGGVVLSSSTPPPAQPQSGGTAVVSAPTLPYPLSPSHLELCLDLRNDEYDMLLAMFDRYKVAASARLAASQEYARTLEAAIAEEKQNRQANGNGPRTGTEQESIQQLHAKIASLERDLASSKSSHSDLLRQHFLLGHKYATVKSCLTEFPTQLSTLDSLAARVSELEHDADTYRDGIDGPAGVRAQYERQVQALTAELAEAQAEAKQSHAQIKTLTHQLTVQSQERATLAQKSIDDLMSTLEYQKNVASVKQSAVNEKYLSTKKLNASLMHRVLELEMQLSHHGGAGSASSLVPSVGSSQSAAVAAARRGNKSFDSIDEDASQAPTPTSTSAMPISPHPVSSSSSSLTAALASAALAAPRRTSIPSPHQLTFASARITPQPHAHAFGPSAAVASARSEYGRHSPASSHPDDSSSASRLQSVRSPSYGGGTPTNQMHEKSAPIPIGAPSPQGMAHMRSRSSSRGMPLNVHTPPDWNSGGSMAASVHLPNPVLPNHAGLIIGNINPPQLHVGPSGSGSGGVLIPPHEQRLHANANRRQAMQSMLGRAAIIATAPSGDLNSSDEDLLEEQFSPSPTKAFKSRMLYSPPLQ